jgi:hypothetical protein
MKTFTVYTDPTHGWVKVPVTLLDTLGIADKITRFSYRRGAYAYLEEDLDMCTFASAYRIKYGTGPQWVSKHANKSSKIKSYSAF